MTFAFPIALTLAALALPIIALYIVKVRFRRVPVSTNMFWQQVFENRPPRAIWRRFQHLLSLLLQLLLLMLLVAAIADPWFSWQLQQAQRSVIIIDNSASMRATDVKPSRLDAARKSALKFIDSMRLGDETAIILAGPVPEVVAGMTDRTVTLRDTVDAVPFSDKPTAIDDALQLAKQLIGSHPHPRIIVLTDGCAELTIPLEAQVQKNNSGTDTSAGSVTESTSAPQSDLPPAAQNSSPSDRKARFAVLPEFVTFATEADNVGITQFQARRSFTDPIAYEILISVKNAAARPVSCRVEISLNDIPVDVIPLQLTSEQSWSRSLEKTALEGGILKAVLTEIQSASSQIETHVDDSAGKPRSGEITESQNSNFLATDDSAWAILPERRRQNVLIVSRGNLFLQKVFEANPLVDVTVRKNLPPQSEWPDNSLLVLHGELPATIPAGNVLIVDPNSSSEFWDAESVQEDVIVTEQDQSSPLMSHIQLDNVLIPRLRRLVFKKPVHALAQTISDDLVYAEVPRDSGRLLVLNVSLDSSDLAFRTVFPILAANALNWFAGTSGELQESVSTGSMTSWNPERASPYAADTLAIQSPSGKNMRLQLPDKEQPTSKSAQTDVPDQAILASSALALGPFAEVGVWEIKAAENSETASASSPDNSNAVHLIAVNLASERETDLRPVAEITNVDRSQTRSSDFFSRPLWYFFVLAACILLASEWILYQRRLIS